jgi:hypothetical protein
MKQSIMLRLETALVLLGIVSWIGHAFIVPPQNTARAAWSRNVHGRTAVHATPATHDMFFASVTSSLASTAAPSTATTQQQQRQQQDNKQQRRALGSQELLMLPRQYGPNPNVEFPQMNHVSCTVLSATPSLQILQQAVQQAIEAHPLLYSHVQGDGEPTKRIDLLQMVREGEPDPCTFVATPGCVTVDNVLTVVPVEGNGSGELDKSWKKAFGRDLDDGAWCDTANGPLWRLEWHRLKGSGASDNSCALVFAFNHAISDQSSANRLADQIIRNVAELEERGSIPQPAVKHCIPVAVEDAVMGEAQRWNEVQASGLSIDTARYVLGKAMEGFKSPVILPDDNATTGSGNPLGALTIISGKAAGGKDKESKKRRSTLQFRSLSKDATDALLDKCRENGVSITNALSAAVTLTSTDFIDGGTPKKNKRRNYKILQSLDMRRFGEQLDCGDTVACMAGSMDLLHGPLQDRSGQMLRRNPTEKRMLAFWDLAKEGKKQTEDFIASDGPRHAVRVFDAAMTISDMNNLVHLTAQSKDSQGRAYSAGITNVGVYDRQHAFRREGEAGRTQLKVKHGRFEVEDVFFATSHARTGCLYQVSCQTVGGKMDLVFHPVAPITSVEINLGFANAFTELLEVVAGVKDAGSVEEDDDQANAATSLLPQNSLVLATAAIGTAAVANHAGAWASFFSSVMQMKDNVSDPADFWAALNFWIFFAVGHPILQPILWISDVLHGSPGPMIADLVPVTFLLGNVVVIGAVTLSKEVSCNLEILYSLPHFRKAVCSNILSL